MVTLQITALIVKDGPYGETVTLHANRTTGNLRSLAVPHKPASAIAIRSEPNNLVSVTHCKNLHELEGLLITTNSYESRGSSSPKISEITAHDQIDPTAGGIIDIVLNGIPIVNFKVGSESDVLAEIIKQKFDIKEIDCTTLKVTPKMKGMSLSDLVYNLHLIANDELKAVEVTISGKDLKINPNHNPAKTFRLLEAKRRTATV